MYYVRPVCFSLKTFVVEFRPASNYYILNLKKGIVELVIYLFYLFFLKEN